LSHPGKHVTIYGVANINGKSFSKPFTKHKTEKGFHVTGIYPLNKNIFGEDEFLSLCVTERTYNQVIEPTCAPSSSKDNNGEGISAGFMKVSPRILQSFPKDGPRKTREENMEKAGSQQTHQRRLKLQTKEPQGVRENIQGKCSKKL